MKLLIALAAALVVVTALSNGQSLSFDLTGGSVVDSSTRTFTSNGVTATATALSYTGGNNEFFEVSKLGQYGSAGLGVTNKHEDGSSPGHRVDNFENNDYILFTFDNLVDVTSIQIASIVDDSDVSYWVGNLTPNGDPEISYSDLASIGFGNEQMDNVSGNYNSRSVDINSPISGVNAIIFGARRDQTWTSNSDYIDQFKVKHLKATVVIPEPSTVLLSFLGVVGICFRRRR